MSKWDDPLYEDDWKYDMQTWSAVEGEDGEYYCESCGAQLVIGDNRCPRCENYIDWED